MYGRWWKIYRTLGDSSHYVQIVFNTISLRINSYGVIVMTWMIAAALALPPLVGWSYYAPESNGIR